MSGLNYEGNSGQQTADLHAMRAWVCAQLSWDATRDGHALIEEFLVNYYSEGAAGYIMQVRKTPSWPRSWANFSLLQTVFPREFLAILEFWPSNGHHGPTCTFYSFGPT